MFINFGLCFIVGELQFMERDKKNETFEMWNVLFGCNLHGGADQECFYGLDGFYTFVLSSTFAAVQVHLKKKKGRLLNCLALFNTRRGHTRSFSAHLSTFPSVSCVSEMQFFGVWRLCVWVIRRCRRDWKLWQTEFCFHERCFLFKDLVAAFRLAEFVNCQQMYRWGVKHRIMPYIMD